MSYMARVGQALAAGTANPLYPVVPSPRVMRGGFVVPHVARRDHASTRLTLFGPRTYCSDCGALVGDPIHRPENGA